jgi:IS30 family transposase
MLTIHDRPFGPLDRSRAGHWEGDLVIDDNHPCAIGTLVERHTQIGCDSLVWPRCDGLIWPRVRLAGVLTV